MNYLKIAVLNNSGNVGKSTICQTFLMPRIDQAELIRVETLNHDGVDTDGLSSKDMTLVIQKIDMVNKAVIDVGSSNIENFMAGLKRNSGSHEDIDFYIVPTTPEVKQQKDTVTTVDSLIDIGVNPSSIFVILNKTDELGTIERQYQTILDADIVATLEKKSISDFPTIFESEIFNLLEKIQCSFMDVLNDSTDYKKEIRATDDKELRSILSIKRTANRLAKSHYEKMNFEFSKFLP